MRIAVASLGLDVSPRFEYAEGYTCYNVDRGIIVDCQNMPIPKTPYADTAQLLRNIGVSALIVGAIPIDIANVFCRSNIEVVAGATGSARGVAEQYLTKTLTGIDEVCSWDEDQEEFDRATLESLGCAV